MINKLLAVISIFLGLSVNHIWCGEVFRESFENGMSGWTVSGNVSLSTEESFEGKYSLRLIQDRDGELAIARRSVPFDPMKHMYYSVKVLAPDDWTGYTELEDYGLVVELEWFDANGKRLGRAGDLQLIRPSARKPGEWATIGGSLKHTDRKIPLNGDSVTPIIPQETARVDLVLKISDGTSGTFYADDIELKPISAPLLYAEVISPVYKRHLDPNADNQIHIDIVCTRETTESGNITLEIVATLYGPDEEVLDRVRYPAKIGRQDVRFSISGDAPDGEYTVELAMVEKDSVYNERLRPDPQWGTETGSALEGRSFTFFKREVPPMDSGLNVSNRKLIRLNNEPVLFTAIYQNTPVAKGSIDKALLELQHIAESGAFDAVMNYGIVTGDFNGILEYLDKAHELGLGVIFCVKDIGLGYSGPNDVPKKFNAGLDELSFDPDALLEELVMSFKDHPAVIGWYVSDEDSVYKLKRLNARYEQITRLDPYNPVFVAYVMTDFPFFVDTGDVVGMHIYPVGRRKGQLYGFRSIYERVREARAALGHEKPLSHGLQAFDYRAFQSDLPDSFPDQWILRNMMYQSLIGGADMLLAYSYTYMIQGYRAKGADAVYSGEHARRFSEVVVPVFKEAKFVQPYLLGGETLEIVVHPEHDDEIVVGGWSSAEGTLILAANTSRNEADLVIDLSASGLDYQGEDAPDGVLRRTLGAYQTLCIIVNNNNLKKNIIP